MLKVKIYGIPATWTLDDGWQAQDNGFRNMLQSEYERDIEPEMPTNSTLLEGGPEGFVWKRTRQKYGKKYTELIKLTLTKPSKLSAGAIQ